MKRTSLIAAAAVVVVANGFALSHAYFNRVAAQPDLGITMTERELATYSSSTDDDSSVTLHLQWRSYIGFRTDDESVWLNVAKLRELGFDTSVSPSDSRAAEFYPRQRARRVFVAFEYDGPAWQRHVDQMKKEAELQPDRAKYLPAADQASRLVAIDAALDAATLRTRHPAYAQVIIVPATIRIWVDQSNLNPEEKRPRPRISGAIQEIPDAIHVPLPFSRELRARAKPSGSANYRVHLRYGSALEAWVERVEFR